MRRAALAGIALASLALACTEKGRSVVLVDVNKAGTLTSAPSVSVYVTQAGQVVGHADGGALPQKLGVYLPKNVSGAVGIVACGYDGDAVLGSGVPTPAPVTITITPGESSGPFIVPLTAGASSQFCTRGGTGGQGGGGGSTGGRGGAGGSTGGAGGTGGGGGTGGSTAGAGGGGIGGGLAGQSGTGGGLAGTGGAGGALAGRGGSAGGGTTGTGGAWHGSHGIATEAVTENFPSVAVDFNGNAVVAYQHGADIYVNHYTFASDSWSGPIPIATGGNYEKPQVAVDGTGRYLVIWGPGSGATTLGAWQASSSDGINWNTTLPMVTTDDALKPVMSMNGDGIAVIVWTEKLPSGLLRLVACQRSPTGGLSQIAVVHPADSASDLYPAVAISKVGEMFVTWEGSDGDPVSGHTSVWMKQLKNSQWQGEYLFELYNDNDAYRPSIATNDNSDAIVTYLQWTMNAQQKELWSKRYTGGVWAQTALRVASSADIDTNQAPAITLDKSGTATAVFGLVDTQGRINVHSNRLTAIDTMWPNSPFIMESDNYTGMDNNGGTQATLPVVRGDGNGNVIAVWRKRPGGTTRWDLWARQYTAGAWQTPVPLESTTDTTSVFAPALGMNGSSVAIAAWYYGAGGPPPTTDVYANIFR